MKHTHIQAVMVTGQQNIAGIIGNSLKVSACHNANAFKIATNYYATRNSKTVTLAGGGLGIKHRNTFVVGDRLLLGLNREVRKIASLSGNTITLTSAYTGNTISNYASLTRQWEFYGNFDTVRTTTYANSVNSQGDALHVAVVDEDGVIVNQVQFQKHMKMFQWHATDETGTVIFYKNKINDLSNWIWFGGHNSNASKAGTRRSNKLWFCWFGNKLARVTILITLGMTDGKDGSASDAAYITAYDKFKIQYS